MPALIRWLRQRPCEVWFGLASLLLSLPLALPPFRSLASYANWTPGYYYINYWEFGFVKRGLLGSFWSATRINSLLSPVEFTRAHHIASLIIFAILFWSLCQTCLRESPVSTKKIGLYIVFLLSPALFLHFGFDLGRADLVGLNLCIAILLVARSLLKNTVKIVATTALTIIGLLIHEAFLLFWCPVIWSAIVIHPEKPPMSSAKLRWLSIWCLSIVIVLAALRIWGDFELGPQELALRFKAIHPSLEGAMRIELTSDLVRDNIELGIKLAKNYNYFGNNAFVAAYAIGFAWVYVNSLIKSGSSLALMVMLAIAPLGSLLLNLLGQDFIRALSCSIASACLMWIYLCSSHPKALKSLSLKAVAGLAPFALIGPLGIVPSDPIPFWKYFPLS